MSSITKILQPDDVLFAYFAGIVDGEGSIGILKKTDVRRRLFKET